MIATVNPAVPIIALSLGFMLMPWYFFVMLNGTKVPWWIVYVVTFCFLASLPTGVGGTYLISDGNWLKYFLTLATTSILCVPTGLVLLLKFHKKMVK